MWLFYYFDFERNYDVLKSNNPCILLNKNINFKKNETEWKMENPTHLIKDASKLHRPSHIRLGAVAYFFEVINFILTCFFVS